MKFNSIEDAQKFFNQKHPNTKFKGDNYEGQGDIFDQMKNEMSMDLNANFSNKKKEKKQVKSVSTSTKTVTTNGIKKTTVTKTTKYVDGSVETITTTT